MSLTDGQIQVRDLVMGSGTPYEVLSGTNPFVRAARSGQGAARPRGHGSWAGPEYLAEAVVPLQILVKADSAAQWLARHRALQAAFRPVGPGEADVEFRYCLAGSEFVMFGRPRMVEPDMQTYSGDVVTRCGFVALDPLHYSGAERTQTLSLPTTSGGLTLPLTAPLSIAATFTSGRAAIANAGSAEVGLKIRIDGPVFEPRVSLLVGATTTTLRLFLTVEAGQWLEIDTSDHARTVYLNGQASRRNFAAADRGNWPSLPTGPAEIAFNASAYSATAQLTVRWRDAWY